MGLIMKNKSFEIVYLGLQPVSSKSEGLNVLLCDMIKPMIEMGVKVVIHTTNRHRKSIFAALSGNEVDLSLVTVNVHKVASIVIPLLTSNSEVRNNNLLWESIRFFLKKKIVAFAGLAKDVIIWLIDITIYSLPYKLLVGVLISFVSLLVLLVAAAPGLIFYISLKLLKGVNSQVNKIKSKLRDNKILRPIIKPLVDWWVKNFVVEVLHILYEREQCRFIDSISRNNKIKKLFFFTLFEGAAVKRYNGKALVVFPDVVTAIFPTRFQGMHNKQVLDSIEMSVKYASGLICYSSYVRDKQLLPIFSEIIQSKKITVIPQGCFELKHQESFCNREDLLKRLNGYEKYLKNLFPELLAACQKIDFASFSYILYPTIDRPHKNTLTLIKAFEILLRKKHNNIKLILTTHSLTLDVRDYIFRKRLHYDVLIMPSVPVNVLDDLFLGAGIMVHPSLAEGGDIFNFSRAVSVGCPALMADVPVVREMFDRRGIDRSVYQPWLFDPFDSDELAEIIDNILLAREDIISSQAHALTVMSEYNYSHMAKSYLDTYEGL